MKRTIAILAVLAAGIQFARAIPFVGTFSGEVTLANNASFLMFNNNPPIQVGDLITGTYTYDSPTIDVLNTFDIASFTMTVGPVTFGGGGPLLYFGVQGGHLKTFSYVGDVSRGNYSYLRKVNQTSLVLNEITLLDNPPPLRSDVSGTLRFNDPVPVASTVPDNSTGTASLLCLGIASVGLFRRFTQPHKLSQN